MRRRVPPLLILISTACAALALAFTLAASANEPNDRDDVHPHGPETNEVVGSYWFGKEDPASATAFTCFTEDDTSTPALFPWNTTVNVDCDGDVVACWLMSTDDITIDSDGVLTDASSVGNHGADGRGPCRRIPASIPVPLQNSREALSGSGRVGRRYGACATAGVYSGRPCDETADCEGSNTCTATTSATTEYFNRIEGAYLCLTAESGSATDCSANVELR